MPPTASLPSAAQAESALESYQMPSSADVLTNAENQYGVPQLQTNVNNLRTLTGNLTNSIAAVDPSVTGRTAGTLTTEAQRGAIVDRERAPVVAQLGTANTALGQSTDDFNTANTNAKDAASATESDNQNKYNALLQTYNIANAREAAQAQAQQSAAQQAEAVREFNVSQANSSASAAAAVNPAAGYSVKQQAGSGNHLYTGPNGQTNLYQYASALNGGDANGTFNTILSQLKSGSQTDKNAYNKVANMSQAQAIAYLRKNNAYIFN